MEIEEVLPSCENTCDYSNKSDGKKNKVTITIGDLNKARFEEDDNCILFNIDDDFIKDDYNQTKYENIDLNENLNTNLVKLNYTN